MSEPRNDAHARHRRYGFLSWTVAALSVLLAVGTLIADEARDQAAAAASDEEFYRGVEVFTEVFHEIQEKYVEEVDTQELMEAAIRGMFQFSLDRHSQYMNADIYDQLTQSTQGEFYGIGIHITMREGVLTVIAPIPGSPSARLGIQPWDRIIEIEGESTESMELTEAVRRLKGPEGTQVSIRVFRAPEEPGGEPQLLDFTITRAKIEIESVFSRRIGDDIGYIRLAQFSEETAQHLREALRSLEEEGVQALILDLRVNTGGLLSQACEVANLFLPRDMLIVQTEGRIPTQNRRYLSEHDALTNLPVLVLVNEGSASASEIVAGALQDHRRALIVGPEGTTTFGKGSVQTIEELDHAFESGTEGGPRPVAIRLTTARYLTPSGRSIDGSGIEPDIGVPLPVGHERELLRRGLLGEPSMVESEEHLDAVRQGLSNGQVPPPPEPEVTDTEEGMETEEEPESPDSVIEVDLQGEREGAGAEEEFHDILLDEAVRYLRVYTLMRRELS